MRVEIVNVTPALAARWLATSLGNPRWKTAPGKRPKMIDDKKVAKMVRDMQSDRWYPGNNTIAFDENGNLIDGHHRLSAIVKSGVTIQTVVIWGITEYGQLHVDDNSVRQESARTGIDRNVLSVANAHYACVNRFEIIVPKALTTEEKVTFLDLHPCVYEVERITHAGGKDNSLLHFAGGTHALMCAAEYGVSTTKLKEFSKAVTTGFIKTDEESSAICIRNTLLRARHDNSSKRRVFYDYAIQAAIYDYCSGIPRRKPYRPKTGVYFDMNIAHGNRLYTSMWGDA